MFRRFIDDETGATAIEYGLIASFLGVAIVASLVTLRGEYEDMYGKINDTVTTANAP